MKSHVDRRDVWHRRSKKFDPFRFHPRIHELEERRLLSGIGVVDPASNAPPTSVAVSSPSAGSTSSGIATNGDGTTTGTGAAPGATSTTSTDANETTTVAAQTAVVQAAIAINANITSPGFATPLAAVVGLFGSIQAPTDPTALASTFGPIQPSQFSAPRPAPLTGGDVALASPNSNQPSPSQNLNDDLIAQLDPMSDRVNSAAADELFETLVDMKPAGAAPDGASATDSTAADLSVADAAADPMFTAAVDKLAADQGLPSLNDALDRNYEFVPATDPFDNSFQNPIEMSPAPDSATFLRIDQAPIDERPNPGEWTRIGAVAATAGAGLWAYRKPTEDGAGGPGRRLRVDQRPRW